MTWTNPSAPTSVIRQVHIAHDEHGAFWVRPPPDEKPAPFTPFPMPKFSASLFGSLMAAGHTHIECTQRCLAVLLLLDVEKHHWRCCVPWQECSTDSVCWRLDRLDGLDVNPQERLAGVYQAVVTADLVALPHSVPMVSGLHFMQQFSSDQPGPGVWVCLRMGDQNVIPIHPGQVLENDVWTMLAECASRLTMV